MKKYYNKLKHYIHRSTSSDTESVVSKAQFDDVVKELAEANRKLESNIYDATAEALDHIWKRCGANGGDYTEYNEAHRLLYKFRNIKVSTSAILEGHIKRGGMGELPTTKKPDIKPKSQNVAERSLNTETVTQSDKQKAADNE